MRYFAYNELDKGQIIMSEKEILDSYFDIWKQSMIEIGKESLVTPENCIDDWAVNYWAWEVESLSHD